MVRECGGDEFMKPMFSIVIPVYNVAPYLRECLDSVLAQTFTDWEAICVDDGSTDDSGMILNEYAAKDSRFKVVHQQNKGVSSARNVALDLAQGEWICFVDSDDIVHPNWLSRIFKVILDSPALEYIRWECKKIQSKVDWHVNSEESVSRHEIFGFLDFEDYYVPLWRAAYRRSMIGNLRFSDYVRGEDVLFNTQYVLRIKKVGVLGEKLYGYRVRPNSALTGKITFRKLRDEVRYRIDCLGAIFSRKGKVDERIFRQQERFLMGYFVRDMGSLSLLEQRRLLEDWRRVANILTRNGHVSCVSRALSAVCCSVKSVVLFRVIFGINYLIRIMIAYIKG